MLCKREPKLQSLVTIDLLKLMLKTGNAKWIRYQIMMSKKEYQRDLSISSKIYIAIWDQWMFSNNKFRVNKLKRKIWYQYNVWWHQWACQLFKKKCKRKWTSKAKEKLDFSARLQNSFLKNQRKMLITIQKNLLKHKIWIIYKKKKNKSQYKVTHSQCNKFPNRSEWMMNSLLNSFQLLNQKKASGDYHFKFNQFLKF